LRSSFAVYLRRGGERAEHLIGHLHQDDPDTLEVQLRIGHRQRDVPQLGQGAGHLDPGRPGPHDDGDRFDGLGPVLGHGLDVTQEDVADLDRGLSGVDRPDVLLGPGNGEVVGGDPATEHEVVVPDLLAGVGADVAAGGVHPGHAHAAELCVAKAGGEGPQRVGDVAWIQATGRDLVQQRLEGAVQVPVQ
jgi:hypothetical protein